MTTTPIEQLHRVDPVIITTSPAEGDPLALGHYLNLGLTPDQVIAFQQLRPAIHGPVAAALALTFIGGFLTMGVGVLGAWSANGFDFLKVMSSQSVMPVDSAVWGSAGMVLLAAFVATLIVSQRAYAAAAAVFDRERALLWDECRGSLAPAVGFSGEAEDALGRMEALAAEANGLWKGKVPLSVRESFVAACAALAARSAGEAGRVLDGVAEALAGKAVVAVA
jgi:hypothetical protein